MLVRQEYALMVLCKIRQKMIIPIKAGLEISPWLQQGLRLTELTKGRKKSFLSITEIFKREKNELRGVDSISNVISVLSEKHPYSTKGRR